MADPITATTVPHLIGVTLDTQGVAETQVIAVNRTTSERLIKATDASKRVIFDASTFTSGYSDGDIIEFENVGGSYGQSTVTIASIRGNFQSSSLDATATATFTRSM